MNRRIKRRIKRIRHREHTRLLGGKQAADRLRCDAADLRYQHGLCRCSDETRTYLSEAEAAADRDPNVVCSDCGKPRLRVVVITDAPPTEEGKNILPGLLR